MFCLVGDDEDEDDEGAGTRMMMSVLASMERAVTRRRHAIRWNAILLDSPSQESGRDDVSQ